MLFSIESELEGSINKFKKTHQIYTEYCLSLTQETNKLEKMNTHNEE